MEQRIQKILAQMGIASRRKAEELIIEGRVTVNGKIATLGMKADPAKDHIKLDGRLLVKPEPKIYLVFNKPAGVVTSLSDPEGRPTIKDFLKGIKYRVFPVGRLDYDSEGLLLITNDGDFAHNILHPSKKVPKTYVVKVKGLIDENAMERLRRGVRLEDGLTAPSKVKKVRLSESNSWVEITIYEGRKRQVRRMLEKVGYPVIKLRRIAIGSLKLGDLKPGEMRRLTIEEIRKLSSQVAKGSRD
jgi:23S rRNA pseudouridine2605 synthase